MLLLSPSIIFTLAASKLQSKSKVYYMLPSPTKKW
jgi:hypothetical protein